MYAVFLYLYLNSVYSISLQLHTLGFCCLSGYFAPLLGINFIGGCGLYFPKI